MKVAWSVLSLGAIVGGVELAAAAEALRIPLHVDWPNPAAVGPFPVYSGVSFPKGGVTDVRRLGLIDDRGAPVVADFEPLARWTPDASWKWVGARFPARPDRRYFVVDLATETPPTLTLDDEQDALVVDTGALRLELPKRGPLLGSARIGARIVSPGGAACLTVDDQAGRRADETHSDPPQVEYRGPHYVVVRREGALRTESGETLGRYVVRLEFFAGSATVKMQHSFIVTVDTNGTQFADLSVRVAGPSAERRTAWFDVDAGPDDAPRTTELMRDETAYLLQADYPHHGRKTSRRELQGPGLAETSVTDGPDRPAAIGDWSAVAADGGGVLVAVPNAAQLFPKEFEVDAAGVAAHLWSSRGGRLLDYRAAVLADYWGVAWIDAKYPGGSRALRALDTNGHGSARTHDLWLHFFTSDDAQTLAQVGAACSQAPAALQDPHWLRRTEALGYLHPYDPDRFAKLERFLDDTFRDYALGEVERWGDYGFLDYGCGQHTYDNYSKLPGLDPPRLNYRYADHMYRAQTAFWQAYARSGRRMYRDYTYALHRHLADFKFAHAAGRNRSLGSRVGGNGSEDNPFYWTGIEDRFGGGTLNSHQGFDPEGFLLQFYLAGDRRCEEVIRRSGEVFLERFPFDALPEIGASSDGAQPFLLAAPLYLHTGDERYVRALDEIRDRMIRLDTLTGWADPTYFGAWEKYAIKIAGALADFRATGSEITRRMLVERAFPIWLWDVPPTNLGYQEQSGYFASFAYRLTGNVRYAELIDERFNRVLFEYYDARGRRRDVSTIRGGNNSFNFYETAFYGMDLLAATEGKRGPYVALDAGVPCHPVEIHFAKDRHEPLRFELRFRPQYDLRVTWSPAGYGRPRRDYDVGPVHWDAYPNYYTKDAPGLGGGFAKLELGAETVEGEYRLDNVPLIFKHSARKLVLVAREGTILRNLHDRPAVSYFRIPAGKRGAVFTNKPARLTVGDAHVELPGGRWHEFAPAADERTVAFEAQGLVFVGFRGGIPPVLAQHDPSQYFVPRVIHDEMPAREAADSAPDAPNAAPFTAGLTGALNDRAYALDAKRSLRIPRGPQQETGRYERIDYRRGTLEFWYRPRRSTGMSGVDVEKFALGGAVWPVTLKQYAGDDEDPRVGNLWQLTAPCTAQAPPQAKPAPYGYPAQDLRNPTPVVAGRWHHVAISWTTDPQRGWLSELYVDGEPSLGWARFDVGHGRFLEAENAVKMFPPPPWPIDEPAGQDVLFVGEVLDGAIDELRISDVGRYPQPFGKLPPRKLEHDEHTLLLLRFDDESDPLAPAATSSGR